MTSDTQLYIQTRGTMKVEGISWVFSSDFYLHQSNQIFYNARLLELQLQLQKIASEDDPEPTCSTKPWSFSTLGCSLTDYTEESLQFSSVSSQTRPLIKTHHMGIPYKSCHFTVLRQKNQALCKLPKFLLRVVSQYSKRAGPLLCG